MHAIVLHAPEPHAAAAGHSTPAACDTLPAGGQRCRTTAAGL
jgi:hypothetical protein